MIKVVHKFCGRQELPKSHATKLSSIAQSPNLEIALTRSSFSFAIYLPQEELALDEDPEFDTTIAGPWMGQWEIVHHNRHTAQYKEPGDEESWTNYQSKWTKA